MKQRSKEWFEARKGRVTSSIVGAILGNDPNKDRDDVMRAMVREFLGAEKETKDNIATDYGKAHEPGVYIDYRIETTHDVEEVGFIEFEDWLGVSPDGLIGENGILEIKCPFSRRKKPKGNLQPLSEYPHYYDQCQIQLFATDRKWLHFFQWSPAETKLEVVKPDTDWQADAIPRLRQFHAEFLHELKHNADEHLAPRRVEIDTPEAHKMVAEWDEIAEQMERLNERKRDLLDSMVSLAGGKNADIAGRKLTLVSREGSVSYARVVKEHCGDVDLEPYRGKASSYWRLG